MPRFRALLASNGNQRVFLTSERLDARFDWLRSALAVIGDAATPELVWLGDACSAPLSQSVNYTARVVLVELNSKCDAYQQVQTALKIKALGLSFFLKVCFAFLFYFAFLFCFVFFVFSSFFKNPFHTNNFFIFYFFLKVWSRMTLPPQLALAK